MRYTHAELYAGIGGMFATSRFILKPLYEYTPDMLTTFFNRNNRDYMINFLEWPEDLHIDPSFARNVLQSHIYKTCYEQEEMQFGVASHECDEIIGEASIHQDLANNLQFSIYVAPDWRGNNVAKETMSAMFLQVARLPHVHTIYAEVQPYNAASQKLMNAIGMDYKGLFESKVGHYQGCYHYLYARSLDQAKFS